MKASVGSTDRGLRIVAGLIVLSLYFFLGETRRWLALIGLALGSLAFGMSWGLAGCCPGPALAWLLSGGVKSLIFLLAMLSGMALFGLPEWRPREGWRKLV